MICFTRRRASSALRRGFTIVELLVVIAITTALAAILFPLFAGACEKAKQSACMSNQRQIAAAILMYAQDNDETLPGVDVWSAISLPPKSLVCMTAGTSCPISYFYHAGLGGKSLGNLGAEAHSVFLTADGTGFNKQDIDVVYLDERHSGKLIGSFADGHVALCPAADLFPDIRPRTLLFSPMNINYLRDTAPFWGEHGFNGFLFDQVMYSWSSDVWAADGNARTRGNDDDLLQELRSCNTACLVNGIDSNFVKVAFYEELPNWFDDAAWTAINENFRQGARFAKMGGCAGVAIDTEYIAYQYDPDWEGYGNYPHNLPAMKAKVRERMRAVTEAMLQEFPNMVFLTLPEGMLYYGELYTDLFAGMLEGMADAGASGGLHVLTEGTYHMLSSGSLAAYPDRVNAIIAEYPPPLASYWRKRCSVAIGMWPLGYYRPIYDADGNFLGYSGKEEDFGNQLVGSYADKSAWYPPEVFALQIDAVNASYPAYNWIYGHGDVFCQWSQEQLHYYQQFTHRSFGNAVLPTDPNVDAYLDVIANQSRR